MVGTDAYNEGVGSQNGVLESVFRIKILDQCGSDPKHCLEGLYSVDKLVTDLHHFDVEQDPDLDTDPH
jgi:hypothetical protein